MNNVEKEEEQMSHRGVIRLIWVILVGLFVLSLISGFAFAGTTIRVLSVADPYPKVLPKLISEFEIKTGIKVELDLLGYSPTYQKMNLDFLAGVSSYQVVSIDAPWEGEVIAAHRVMALDDLIADTDPEVLKLDDFIMTE